ncbi:MAG: zinc ribbon domain-containing protein [Acidobacteria bacterium]|nr:zinc ribbon domain-containing protein [Acidobacteriota bacterium]
MPRYEFICHNCHKSFALDLSLADYDQGHVTCPKCKSRKVEQKLSTFAAVTSKKS